MFYFYMCKLEQGQMKTLQWIIYSLLLWQNIIHLNNKELGVQMQFVLIFKYTQHMLKVL